MMVTLVISFFRSFTHGITIAIVVFHILAAILAGYQGYVIRRDAEYGTIP